MPRVELPRLDDSTYTRLRQLLHPATPQVLELSILPSSSSPPAIQYDPDPSSPALAIPKSLLVACFLRARSILVTAQQAKPSSILTDDPLSNATEKGILQPGGQVIREGPESWETYGATSVLLLFEPNHQTAANWRKRRLLRLREHLSQADLRQVLQVEWTFITSLLTSPLPPHHAKSTTLWYHRLWLLRNFFNVSFVLFPFELTAEALPSPPKFMLDKHAAIHQKLWQEELSVILRAGDQHPRNYHCWRYARDLWSWILEHADRTFDQTIDTQLKSSSKSDTGFRLGQALPEGMSSKQAWPEQFDSMRSYAAFEVHRWCLQHPRDVSGWSFLAHLLYDLELPLHSENKFEVLGHVGRKTRAANTKVRKAIVSQTISFAQKYSWKGESLHWFLTHMAKEQEMPGKGGEK